MGQYYLVFCLGQILIVTHKIIINIERELNKVTTTVFTCYVLMYNTGGFGDFKDTLKYDKSVE
jgi:hypothetical protein